MGYDRLRADVHLLEDHLRKSYRRPRVQVVWLPDDPRSQKMRARFRAYMLVMCCLGQAFAAFVLADEGLWWMAAGELVTAGLLLTYAYEARKKRP